MRITKPTGWQPCRPTGPEWQVLPWPTCRSRQAPVRTRHQATWMTQRHAIPAAAAAFWTAAVHSGRTWLRHVHPLVFLLVHAGPAKGLWKQEGYPEQIKAWGYQQT